MEMECEHRLTEVEELAKSNSRRLDEVESGKPMTSTQANGARYLISQLSPPTSVPASVSSGTVITAAFINGLKNSLNSIP